MTLQLGYNMMRAHSPHWCLMCTMLCYRIDCRGHVIIVPENIFISIFIGCNSVLVHSSLLTVAMDNLKYYLKLNCNVIQYLLNSIRYPWMSRSFQLFISWSLDATAGPGEMAFTVTYRTPNIIPEESLFAFHFQSFSVFHLF
jgi:hypothetical protein